MRVISAVAYLLIVLAGIVLALTLGDIPGIMEWLWLVMCVWLGLGGLAATVGQLTRRWTGEFVGLPLLASSLVGFGFLQGNLSDWHITVIPSVSLLWAFGLIVLARWRDVDALYRSARLAQRAEG